MTEIELYPYWLVLVIGHFFFRMDSISCDLRWMIYDLSHDSNDFNDPDKKVEVMIWWNYDL